MAADAIVARVVDSAGRRYNGEDLDAPQPVVDVASGGARNPGGSAGRADQPDPRRTAEVAQKLIKGAVALDDAQMRLVYDPDPSAAAGSRTSTVSATSIGLPVRVTTIRP